MDDHMYTGDHYEHGAASSSQTGDVRQYVPAWAVWLFAACFLLIIAVLLLDYCVIRRNALGNTCCTRSRQKRNITSAVHQKRSTNMLLNISFYLSMVMMVFPFQFSTTTATASLKLNRQGQCADQDV